MNNKILNTFLFLAVISGLSLSLFPTPAISVIDETETSNERFGIELNYFESAYECGSGEVDIDVYVYKNGQFFQTITQGDSLRMDDIDSLSDLSFGYYSADCSIDVNISQILGSQDPVPSLAGAYSQTSIQGMLNNLDSYEELYLVELGTDDTSSEYYDLQDVVLIVNHNPNNAPTANQDTATTSIFNTIAIDVLANDTDEDGDELTLTGVDAAFSGGSAVIENNKIVYTAGSVPGVFGMTYVVQDEYGKTSEGNVAITVTASSD